MLLLYEGELILDRWNTGRFIFSPILETQWVLANFDPAAVGVGRLRHGGR